MTIAIPEPPEYNGNIDISLNEAKAYLEILKEYTLLPEFEDHVFIQEFEEHLGDMITVIDKIDENVFNLEVHDNLRQEYSNDMIQSFSQRVDELRTLSSSLEEATEQGNYKCAEKLKNEGNAYFKEGAYEKALEKYETAAMIDPEEPVYFSNSALSLQKLGRWTESIEKAERSVYLDPSYLKGYIIRTKSFVALGDIITAAKSLSSIPDSFESQHDVVELSLTLSAKAKDDGNAFFKEGKYDSALEMYSIAINFDSENHLLYSNRSACYQAKRAWKEAKEDALKVIELNDSFPKGYIHLVRCHIQLSEFDHASAVIADALSTLSKLPEWSTLEPQFKELSNSITTSKASANAKAAASDKSRGESLKSRGNQMYQNGDYQEAIKYYSQAIGACPDEGTYFGNRAACWMMLKEYQQVVSDCNQGITLEKQAGDMDKLRFRLIDAMVHMGKLDEALNFIGEYNRKRKNGEEGWFTGSTQFQQKHQTLQSIKSNIESAKQALENKEFSRAKRLYQQIETSGVTEDPQVLINLAKAHLGLKEFEDAAKFSQQAISLSGTKGGVKALEAYTVRGEALASQGLTEQACKYFSVAVQLDPDNQVASQRLKFLRKVQSETVSVRKRIGEAMGERKYDVAVAACSDGLVIDKTCLKLMAEMHYKRAQAYQGLGKAQAKMHTSEEGGAEAPHLTSFKKCLQDANSAMYYDKAMIDAFYMKIEALQTLNRHDEAVSELEQLVSEKQYRRDEVANEKLKQAKLLLKRSKRKDLYTILNVEKGSLASDEEIKKAYKKSALKWHPDRHSSGTEEKKKEAEAKFKEIQSAFELLTDPQKRRLYDQGYDEEEIDQKMEMEKQYASGGGGFGGFGGGYGGGFGGFGGGHSHGGGRSHYGFH